MDELFGVTDADKQAVLVAGASKQGDVREVKEENKWA